MITFSEYLQLKNRDTRSDIDRDPLSDAEYVKMREFERAQPRECPRCSAQVFDPFGIGRVVHNVEACVRFQANQ